jgi:hypothetical protein
VERGGRGIEMPVRFTYGDFSQDTRKIWRYPGVPIPWRLRYRYKVK